FVIRCPAWKRKGRTEGKLRNCREKLPEGADSDNRISTPCRYTCIRKFGAHLVPSPTRARASAPLVQALEGDGARPSGEHKRVRGRRAKTPAHASRDR